MSILDDLLESITGKTTEDIAREAQQRGLTNQGLIDQELARLAREGASGANFQSQNRDCEPTGTTPDSGFPTPGEEPFDESNSGGVRFLSPIATINESTFQGAQSIREINLFDEYSFYRNSQNLFTINSSGESVLEEPFLNSQHYTSLITKGRGISAFETTTDLNRNSTSVQVGYDKFRVIHNKFWMLEGTEAAPIQEAFVENRNLNQPPEIDYTISFNVDPTFGENVKLTFTNLNESSNSTVFSEGFAQAQSERLFSVGTFVDTNTSISQPLLQIESDAIAVESIIKNSYIIDFSVTVRERIAEDNPKPEYFMKSLYREFYRKVIDPEYKLDCDIADTVQKFISSNTGHIRDANNSGELLDTFPNYVKIKINRPNSIFENDDDNLSNRDPAVSYPLNFLETEYDKYLIEALNSEPSTGISEYTHFRNHIQITDESSPESLQSARTNDQFFVGFLKCLKTSLKEFVQSKQSEDSMLSWANSLHLSSIQYPLKFENYNDVTALKARDDIKVAEFETFSENSSTAHYRKYSNIFDGQKARSGIIGYKIEKYRIDNNVKVQTFYVMEEPADKEAPSLEFIDTQVVYGRSYLYRIFSLSLVFGTQYSFSGDSNINVAEATVEKTLGSSPYVRLVETPFYQKTISLFDLPPLPPEVSFVPNQREPKKLSVILNHNVGNRIENPIMIEYADLSTFQKMRSVQSILQGEIEYLSDSIPREYHIYMLEDPPRSYKDFGLSSKYPVETNFQKSVMFTDLDIEVNQDYYFTFRSYESSGVSNPTPVYKVKMVDSANGAFMLLEEYDMYHDRSTYSNLCFERVLKISPSAQQRAIKYPEGTDLSSREFSRTAPSFEEISIGTSEQSIWDKKYKFRITSKNTGRKIDINSVFKVNTLRNDPFFQFTRDTCVDPEPTPPPEPEEPPRQDPIVQPCSFSETLPSIPMNIFFSPRTDNCEGDTSNDGTPDGGRIRLSANRSFEASLHLDLNNIQPHPDTGEPMNIFEFVHMYPEFLHNSMEVTNAEAPEGAEDNRFEDTISARTVDCDCPQNPDIPMNPLPDIVFEQYEREQNDQQYIAILDTFGEIPPRHEADAVFNPARLGEEYKLWWTDSDNRNVGRLNPFQELYDQYFFPKVDANPRTRANPNLDSTRRRYAAATAAKAMCLEKVKHYVGALANGSSIRWNHGSSIGTALDRAINKTDPEGPLGYTVPVVREFIQNNRQAIIDFDYDVQVRDCIEITRPDAINPGGINVKITHESNNFSGHLEIPEGTGDRKMLVSLKVAPEVGNQVVLDVIPGFGSLVATDEPWTTLVNIVPECTRSEPAQLVFNATNFSTAQEISFEFLEDTVQNFRNTSQTYAMFFEVNQVLTTDPKYILNHINETNRLSTPGGGTTFRTLEDAGLQVRSPLVLVDNDVPGFDISVNDGTIAIEWDGTINNRILNMNIGQVYKIGFKPTTEPLTPAGIALQQEYPDRRRSARAIRNFLGSTLPDRFFSGNGGETSQFIMMYSDPSIHGFENAGTAHLRKFGDNPTNDVIDRKTHEDAQRNHPPQLAELGLITVKSKPSDEGVNAILRFVWKPGPDTTDPDNWQNYKYIWIQPKKKPNDQRDELNSCPTIQFKVPTQDDSDDIGKYNRMKVRLRVKFNSAGSGEVNECEPGFVSAIDEDGNSVCMEPENVPCPELVIDGEVVPVERIDRGDGQLPTCTYSLNIEELDEWMCPTIGGKTLVVYHTTVAMKGMDGDGNVMTTDELRDAFEEELRHQQARLEEAMLAFKNESQDSAAVASDKHIGIKQSIVDRTFSQDPRTGDDRITFERWKELSCPLDCDGTFTADRNPNSPGDGFQLNDNFSPFDRYCACPEGTDFAGLRPEYVSPLISTFILNEQYKTFVERDNFYCNNPKKSNNLGGHVVNLPGTMPPTQSRAIRLRVFVEGLADVDFNPWSGQQDQRDEIQGGRVVTGAMVTKSIPFGVCGRNVMDISLDDWNALNLNNNDTGPGDLIDLILTSRSGLKLFQSATHRMELHIQDPEFDSNQDFVGWSNHPLLLDASISTGQTLLITKCNPITLGIPFDSQTRRDFFDPFPTFDNADFLSRANSRSGVRGPLAKPSETTFNFPTVPPTRFKVSMYPRSFWAQSSDVHTAGGTAIPGIVNTSNNARAYGIMLEYYVGGSLRTINYFTRVNGENTSLIRPSNLLIPRTGEGVGVSYMRYTNYNPTRHQLSVNGVNENISISKGSWNMWHWMKSCFNSPSGTTPIWPVPMG